MDHNQKLRQTPIAQHANRGFEIAQYDSSWPIMYKKVEEDLISILGSEATRIEHVGSTAVPGMSAKPQIDVLVIVKNLNEILTYYEAMAAAGLTARGDYTGEGEEYFTKDNEDGKRLVSVHILEKGNVWAEDLITVRDYLRSHSEEAKLYSDAKEQAFRDHPHDYGAYYMAKHKVIQTLRQRAANWAREQKLNG